MNNTVYVNLTEAQKALGIGRDSLMRLCENDQIPHVDIGTKGRKFYRVDINEVRRYLKSKAAQTPIVEETHSAATSKPTDTPDPDEVTMTQAVALLGVGAEQTVHNMISNGRLKARKLRVRASNGTTVVWRWFIKRSAIDEALESKKNQDERRAARRAAKKAANPAPDGMISIIDAAEIAKVSDERIRQLCRAGRVRGQFYDSLDAINRPARLLFVSKEDIEKIYGGVEKLVEQKRPELTKVLPSSNGNAGSIGAVLDKLEAARIRDREFDSQLHGMRSDIVSLHRRLDVIEQAINTLLKAWS